MSRPTPGPWQWYGNTKCNLLYLSTVNHGRRFVMQFKRWGMRDAQPMFQVKRDGYGVMVPASELVKFEVGDGKATGHEQGLDDPTVYRMDIASIDHPDARAIAAASTMFSLLERFHGLYSKPDGTDEDFEQLRLDVHNLIAEIEGEGGKR